MNNDKMKPFKQALLSYYKSKSLSADRLQALNELTHKVESENPHSTYTSIYKRSNRIWVISAMAASLMMALFIASFLQQPDIITAAYEDTIKDTELNNGLAQQQSDWISENKILPVPAQYRVEMSKFCDLDGEHTTHLRIAGLQQGKMNIFFKKGARPYHFGKKSGVTDNMHWKVLEPKKDLTVIVMYTKDMREHVVNSIVNNMLQDLVA